MARRAAKDLLTNDREMFRILSDSSGESNAAVLKIAKRALRKIIEEQLTARQKQFIVLYYYKEMDMPSIAQMCNVNASTVSRTLNRARQKIFAYMKYYFDD